MFDMKSPNPSQKTQGSLKSKLAAMGLPALLAIGLTQPAQEASIIVAGGNEVAVEELALTQYCWPCDVPFVETELS